MSSKREKSHKVVTLSLLMIDPIQEEKELKVYESKDAAPYAKTIVERVIGQREPCVLVLPTGAGKSTVIPYAFVKAGLRIMIAEPTVAMCENVVNSFRAMFPSIKIGKSYNMQSVVPKDARLVVTSNGTLKKRLLGTVKTGGVCSNIEWTDILMLDEVHMGALDTHIIVSIWYYCSMKFSATARMPRLLLSSATASDVLFSRKFSPCVYLPPELLIKTPYSITSLFADKDYGMQDNSRYKDMGSLIRSIHESRPISERILVFLPGRQEMTKTLSACGLKPDVDITLVTIWSESKEEDYEPLKREKDDIRLVIFATPSADAGLTVPNLMHVIDSLLVKNSHIQPNGSTALLTEVASKQLSRQRKGRVGRTAPGMYYPMCTEEFYNSDSMPASYTLEINRLPLYSDIVEMVSHGIQVEDVFAIYNIPSLAPTIEQLLQWGLLRRSGLSGELYASSGGSFMTQSGLSSPRLSGVLFAWVRLGQNIIEGTILMHLIAAMTSEILQFPSFESSNPGDSRGKIERLRTDFFRKKFGRFVGPSDVHTAIRLWNTMIAETASSSSSDIPGDFGAVERWCTANSIQWKTLKNILKSIQKTSPRIVREVARATARDAEQKGISTGESVDAIEVSKNWKIDEVGALPILRRLMEHVYQDQIASRKPDSRPIFVKPDGSTIEPGQGLGFSLQSDPESATQYPLKIIIIGQKTMRTGNLALTQFLDIDDVDLIAKISTDELNSKLGIFLSKTSRRRSIR